MEDAQAMLAQAEQTKAILSQPRSKYVDSTLSISNLTHQHCPMLIKAIQQHYIRAQVCAVHPHVTSRTVKVEHNPTLVTITDICETLNRLGLQTCVVTDGEAAKLILPLLEEDSADEQALSSSSSSMMQPTSQLSLFVILSGIFWVISLLSVVEHWERLAYAGLLSVLFGLPLVAIKACRTLQRCEFDANCMMVTATVGALRYWESWMKRPVSRFCLPCVDDPHHHQCGRFCGISINYNGGRGSSQSITDGKKIDGFARAYWPPSCAPCLGLLWGAEAGRRWTLNGLIIIVISCPCALTISTPVTYAAGLAATAQRGIVVKGGASLEALGNVRIVLLDKTGTLAKGKFKIKQLEEIGNSRSREEMLELLAMMETPSSHPLGPPWYKRPKMKELSYHKKGREL